MSTDEQLQSENVASQDDPIADSSPAPEAEAPKEAEASVAETPEGDKKPNRVQERINQLTREKYEERQKREELESRLKKLESNVPQEPKAELKAPKEDDFENYSDYQVAKDNYLLDMAEQRAVDRLKAEQATTSKASAEEQRQEEIKAKRTNFDKNLEGKRANFENFEEVAYGHSFMDMGLAELIFDMDKGPEVAYHLGSHLDEAERIFALPEIQRARELTKLEFQMQELKPKVVSDAPDPISPLGGGSESVADKDPDDMTVEEWTAWRRKNLEARG